MDFIASLNQKGICYTLAIPTGFSMLYAVSGRTVLLLVFVASLLLFVGTTPAYCKKENCVSFALLAFAAIPTNFRATLFFVKTDFVFAASGNHMFVKILISLLIYGVLFSMEQLALGVLIRAIWPEQNNIQTARPIEEMTTNITAEGEKEEQK